MKIPWIPSYPLSAQRRLWSDWVDAILSLCRFCRAQAPILMPSLVFVFLSCLVSWQDVEFDCIDSWSLSFKEVFRHIVYLILVQIYRNFPKFSDRQVWANNADPDQTAPRAVWSASTLFAIPSASFGCITLRKSHRVQRLRWLQQIFGCPKF